ncbi:MAG: hypothetical protein Q9217_001885 [Psora testacea]
MGIPENPSDEQAATFGVGISGATVGQALYQSLGLPLQGRKNYGATLPVYGGSTARQSGHPVRYTIRNYTNNELTLTFDTISEGSSPEICYDAIPSKGGNISYLLPVTHSRDNVKSTSTLACTITGEGFNMGPTPVLPRAEDLESIMFPWLATKLFAEKQIIAHPTKACGGGLRGVFDGIRQVREANVSRKKLV